MTPLTTCLALLRRAVESLPADDDAGFSTAELLANAALAIAAISAIWLAMGDMGARVVEWIGAQLMQ